MEFSAGKILVGIWTVSAVCALRLCHRHVRLDLASATFPIQKERSPVYFFHSLHGLIDLST